MVRQGAPADPPLPALRIGRLSAAVRLPSMMMAMSWDPRIERRLADYPALRAIGQTPLVPVHLFREELPEVEVLAKMECLNPGGSLKDRPVLRMVLSAPDDASMERKKRMRAHGAQLTVTDPLLGYDEALREVHRRAKTYGDRYFFCDQYGNDDNWRAHYETTAEEVLTQTGGRLSHLVVGVGTGGTITGLGRRLKEHDARVRVVCIIPEAFPGVEGLKPLGRPEDIVPAILDESVIDERVSVGVEEAYNMCQRLAAAGFFVGQSSGAYLAGVERVAKRERRGRFVTLFNDLGERYFSTRLWD